MKATDYEWSVDPAQGDAPEVEVMLAILGDGEALTTYAIDQRWLAAGHEELSGCQIAAVLHRIAVDGHPLFVEDLGNDDTGYRLEAGG